MTKRPLTLSAAKRQVLVLTADRMKAERLAAKAAEHRAEAYHERNMVVCALSKLWPAHLMRHPTEQSWSDDWRWIVCIHAPVGQLCWHIHDDELALFDHLERHEGNHWDGHTTAEKYERLARLTPLKPRKRIPLEAPHPPLSDASKSGRRRGKRADVAPSV